LPAQAAAHQAPPAVNEEGDGRYRDPRRCPRPPGSMRDATSALPPGARGHHRRFPAGLRTAREQSETGPENRIWHPGFWTPDWCHKLL